MDTYGDGKLGDEEIKYGLDLILEKNHSEERIKEIIASVDCDDPPNGHIDFRDFLIATIRTDYHSMMGYFHIAYAQLFDNNMESIGVQDFANQLSTCKVVKQRFIRSIMKAIDKDQSGIITAQEFFEFIITHLGIRHRFTVKHIVEQLEENFVNIG